VKSALGQLVQNLKSLGNKWVDQEVYIIGMHGQYLHLIRGVFPAANVIDTVSNGKALQPFVVHFSKDFDMSSKSDFVEAIQGLVGLFRYLTSGSAQVGGLMVPLSG